MEKHEITALNILFETDVLTECCIYYECDNQLDYDYWSQRMEGLGAGKNGRSCYLKSTDTRIIRVCSSEINIGWFTLWITSDSLALATTSFKVSFPLSIYTNCSA